MDFYRILLVEDEYVPAMLIQKNLEKLGYHVSGPVSSGEEAVQQADRLRPDLILMDIRLSGELDGIDAARQILSHLSTRIIFMTGFSDASTLERAKHLQPAGYLTKPIRPQQIQAAISQAFGSAA